MHYDAPLKTHILLTEQSATTMKKQYNLILLIWLIVLQILFNWEHVTCDKSKEDYSYTYVINLGNIVSLHEEHSHRNRVRGSYSFLQPNGFVRTVQYKVDGDSGFRAAVEYRKYRIDKLKGHLRFPWDFHKPVWLSVPVAFIPTRLLGIKKNSNLKKIVF